MLVKISVIPQTESATIFDASAVASDVLAFLIYDIFPINNLKEGNILIRTCLRLYVRLV